MSDWTWKQFVADDVLRIVNQTKQYTFQLKDIYACEVKYQKQFPDNHHVREKMRQVLQQLRNSDFLIFQGGGKYELNQGFDELEFDNATTGNEHLPEVRMTQRLVRLRNTLLASDMKKRYQNACQICGESVQLVGRNYSEAHHIRPIGTPHLGQDIETNILVLCPNHHVMIDRGVIGIDSQTLLVTHLSDAFKPRELIVKPWHSLDLASLDYYALRIMIKV